MRRLERNRARADEEESVFVTMTDMTISFLLIIMILLAFFATQLNSEDTVPISTHEQVVKERDQLLEELARLRAQLEKLQIANPLEAYLSEAIDQREQMLTQLRKRLQIEFPELEVEISTERDALRFQGEGLFNSGSSQLKFQQRQVVETMGRLLDEILPCFTLGERAVRGGDCDSGDALIEAVQIEGHTDSDGSDLNNLRLSTDRANATLLVMLDEDRSILAHQNLRDQPVMSVSGYGEMRPIATNQTISGKAANRRIDLRIIMYSPSSVEEVEDLSRRLDALRAEGESE
jgi:chemotaxis protein MotB